MQRKCFKMLEHKIFLTLNATSEPTDRYVTTETRIAVYSEVSAVLGAITPYRTRIARMHTWSYFVGSSAFLTFHFSCEMNFFL